MFHLVEVLSVSNGLYDHKGIPFPHGMVLHASKQKGRVVLEPLHIFAQGKKIRIKKTKTRLSEKEIFHRGYALMGKPYDPVFFNCEHLLSDVLGTGRGSPQLRAFLAFGFVAVVGILALRSRTV